MQHAVSCERAVFLFTEKGRIAVDNTERKYITIDTIQETIMRILTEAGKPLAYETLITQIEPSEGAQEAVQALIASGKLLLTRKRKLALPEQTDLVFGRIQGHARGYGFFIPANGTRDAFVPADAMHGAMHGDKVWVRCTGQTSRNGSPEAEVALIVQRAYKNIIGTFEKDGRSGYVIPDERRLPMDLLLTDAHKAKHGDKVVAKIIQYPDGRRPLVGTIEEVLGSKGDAGLDVLSIIRQFELPDTFSKNALRQAKSIAQSVSQDDILTREDLRQRCIVTIDGADAKDMDDAVSLEKLSNGNYLLGVHIADVSAYVKEGTALDRDAYRHGTSVYLLDRVLPMLPPELSNGICSLNPNADRLTLSCFMEIDSAGKVVRHRLAETLICTRYRLIYDDVTQLLEGDAAIRRKYADIVPMLTMLAELANVLNARRVKRGSIDFDIDEARITLDDNGQPVQIDKAERKIANRIIEECMLVANETVAQHMSDLNCPFLYRIHERPEKEKLTDLNVFLQTLGYGIKSVRDLQPCALQRVLAQAKGTPEENIVNKVVLRAMQRARYHETCSGHFGLAARHYCHFTSPIRRYPDLVGHRIIKEMLHGSLNEKRISRLEETLPEIAVQCSERERTAMEAEWAVDDLKKCEYMKKRIGESYAGIIAGVTSFGFFVELENTVEGLVRITSLDDDYYICDEKHYRLVGRSHGRIYRLGDAVNVRIVSVDMDTRNIEMELVK